MAFAWQYNRGAVIDVVVSEEQNADGPQSDPLDQGCGRLMFQRRGGSPYELHNTSPRLSKDASSRRLRSLFPLTGVNPCGTQKKEARRLEIQAVTATNAAQSVLPGDFNLFPLLLP
jgi:hypothetical protein